jgi:hypothetical protein
VASARLEARPGGRLLAWWTTLPWARSIDAAGDSLAPLGRFSGRYVPPSSGPREGAPLERLRAWYDAFTPLVAVESAGSLVAFQFLDAAADDDAAARARSSFLNVYDDSGRPVAADLPLPPGARLLPTNDPDRLYVVTAVRPRQMDIEVWTPRTSR